MSRKKLRWAQAICPVCNNPYNYIEGGHQPRTCSSFDCIHTLYHSTRVQLRIASAQSQIPERSG